MYIDHCLSGSCDQHSGHKEVGTLLMKLTRSGVAWEVSLPHTQHVATHTYTHTHTQLQPTSLLQLLLHLPPKCLHVWKAFCTNGHITILLQSAQTAIALQVVIEDLLCIFGAGVVNECFDAFCDDTLTNEPEQAQPGVNDIKKLCLVFLKKF